MLPLWVWAHSGLPHYGSGRGFAGMRSEASTGFPSASSATIEMGESDPASNEISAASVVIRETGSSASRVSCAASGAALTTTAKHVKN
jgi:hypothetical protein